MTPDEIELARLTTMLGARTNGADAKPGYKQNVALLRTRIAERQDLIDAAAKLVTLHPEPQLDTPPAEAQAPSEAT